MLFQFQQVRMRIQKNFSVVQLYYFLQSFDSYRIVCLNPCIIVYINTDIVNAFSLYQNEFLHDTPIQKTGKPNTSVLHLPVLSPLKTFPASVYKVYFSLYTNAGN